MSEKPQHGGTRPGAGRKPLPDDERRDKIFAVKLTEAEKQLLDEADARLWARDLLLRSARKRL